MPVEKELGTYKPYGISEPVYIRVHAPKADVTGSFVVSVVKHTCATPDDACELVAPGATRTGAPFHIQWPEHRVPVGLNNVRRGYFVHSNTPMARGVADLAFNLIAPSATARAKVVVTSQQGQNRTVEIVGSGKLPFTTTTAADGYSIIVEELAGTSPSSFGIWYDTNATMVASFLGTSSKVRVYVGNETGIGAGSDEARCWLRPESLDFADIGTQYEDELDTGRSLFIDAKRLAFRTQLSASCKEFVGGDGGGLDNSDGVSVPALPFGTASRLYQKARLKMGESGDYELQYSLVKRLP